MAISRDADVLIRINALENENKKLNEENKKINEELSLLKQQMEELKKMVLKQAASLLTVADENKPSHSTTSEVKPAEIKFATNASSIVNPETQATVSPATSAHNNESESKLRISALSSTPTSVSSHMLFNNSPATLFKKAINSLKQKVIELIRPALLKEIKENNIKFYWRKPSEWLEYKNCYGMEILLNNIKTIKDLDDICKKHNIPNDPNKITSDGKAYVIYLNREKMLTLFPDLSAEINATSTSEPEMKKDNSLAVATATTMHRSPYKNIFNPPHSNSPIEFLSPFAGFDYAGATPSDSSVHSEYAHLTPAEHQIILDKLIKRMER